MRDPHGQVFVLDDRVVRVLKGGGIGIYREMAAAGILEDLTRQGLLVASCPASPDAIAALGAVSAEDALAAEDALTIEHPRLPVISYPYEWTFGALKAAALCHLEVQIAALERGWTVIDGTAYNVQFVGAAPIFIDVTSFRRHVEPEYWHGYAQFMDQFVNPLLIASGAPLPFNGLYRGSINGIAPGLTRRLLSWRQKLDWRVLLNVSGRLWSEARALKAGASSQQPARGGRPGKQAQLEIFRLFHQWIEGLQPHSATPTYWLGYSDALPYTEAESQAKRAFVSAFIAARRPGLVCDVGCNTGDYAVAALEAGAGMVVGLESDAVAANTAFTRAAEARLPFLPLVVDASDPSPARGWHGRERRALTDRVRADCVLALAVTHHLVVSGIPLDKVVDWLFEFAPSGIIEFVPETDPMLRDAVASRETELRDYDRETFLRIMASRSRIVDTMTTTGSGRLLVAFDRT